MFCISDLGLSSAQGHDLITLPSYIVIKANDEFKDKTSRPNEMWQTDRRLSVGDGFIYRAFLMTIPATSSP